MFNMGFSEIIVLGAIALLVIGPKQLPELARTVARFYNELRRATGDLKDSFGGVSSEINSAVKEVKSTVNDTEDWMDDQVKKLSNNVDQDLHHSHDEAKVEKTKIAFHEGHAQKSSKADEE